MEASNRVRQELNRLYFFLDHWSSNSSRFQVSSREKLSATSIDHVAACYHTIAATSIMLNARVVFIT